MHLLHLICTVHFMSLRDCVSFWNYSYGSVHFDLLAGFHIRAHIFMRMQAQGINLFVYKFFFLHKILCSLAIGITLPADFTVSFHKQ